MRNRGILVVLAMMLLVVGCGGDDATAEWRVGSATAELSLDDGSAVTFEGGTCEKGSLSSGNDSFVLSVGEIGANGEGASIRIGLELSGGATFAGDGSGSGVQVDHGGGRWGLAEGSDALRFEDDLSGGMVDLIAIKTLGENPDPRSGALEFTC